MAEIDQILCYRWRFLTESGDLGFHIYYLNENKKVDVIPMNRVDCHVCQEEGIIGCPQTVTCQSLLNNTAF